MNKFLSKMLYALTSAYTRRDYENHQRDSPLETNIGKLFAIFAWGLEKVQEQADLIREWDNLDNACGSVLDRYGANFGVKRNGMNDAFYRLAIKVKTMAQLSGGDTDTILHAANELLGVELSDILFEDVFPAKIAMYVDEILLSQERQELIYPIAYSLKRLLAAGVGMRLYLRTYHSVRSELKISRTTIRETYLKPAIIGQDREINGEVPISYGAFKITKYLPPIIGQDRMINDEIIFDFGAFRTTNYSQPIIGRDRLIDGTIPVSFIGLQEIYFAPPNIGQDRIVDETVQIGFGMFRENEFITLITGQDRTAGETVQIGFGTFVENEFTAPVTGQNRTSVGNWSLSLGAFESDTLSAHDAGTGKATVGTVSISHGRFDNPEIIVAAANVDRAVQSPATIAHGAFQTPSLSANIPEVKSTSTTRQDSVGGVRRQTHIKVKRID